MSGEDTPIEIELLGHSFEALAETTAKGSLFWRFPSRGGSGGGVELDPLGESLPTVLTVNGSNYEFGRVPKKKKGGSSVPGGATAFKPFNKAREVRVETHVAGHLLEIHSRVTLRRNGKWNFWFNANPVGQIRQPSDGGGSAKDSPWDKLKRIFPDE